MMVMNMMMVMAILLICTSLTDSHYLSLFLLHIPPLLPVTILYSDSIVSLSYYYAHH